MGHETLHEWFQLTNEDELRKAPNLKKQVLRLIETENACRRVIERQQMEIRKLKEANDD